MASSLLPLLGGCSVGSSGDALDPALSTRSGQPRIVEALFIDTDLNGPDAQDVILLRFQRAVAVDGTRVDGIVTDPIDDDFGDGARLEQSVPGSDVVEVLLGQEPRLAAGPPGAAGVTKINIARSGRDRTRVRRAEDPTIPASASPRAAPLVDITAAAPSLVAASLVDADGDGSLGRGDKVLVELSKPIEVPAGATVAQNFEPVLAGDTFGASPLLEAASDGPAGRAALITLGEGARLSIDGLFAAPGVGAGAASRLRVAASPTIVDTVAGAPATLVRGESVYIAPARIQFPGNGRAAERVLGAPDPFDPAVNAQTLSGPRGVAVAAGPLVVGERSFDVRLLFVVDGARRRVLIFDEFPSGSYPAARWVVGQPDLTSGGEADPASPSRPPASPVSLDDPLDVAFDAPSNRLFVADSGHHRVLVWTDLFEVDAERGVLALPAGKPASFALGQPDLGSGARNRGRPGVSGSGLSSPGGVSIAAGRLLVADTGNHRVLIYGSLPADGAVAPAAVLGQPDLASGLPNRGGPPSASTLLAPSRAYLSDTIVVNGQVGACLVADSGNHRVLLYSGATPTSGAEASRVLGQASFATAIPSAGPSGLSDAAGVTAAPDLGLLFVADRGNHRVVEYSTLGGLDNGEAGVVLGQAGPAGSLPNRGGAPGAGTLQAPAQVSVLGTTLVVSDGGNHRVLGYEGATLPAGHRDATVVVGQRSFSGVTPGARRLEEPVDAALSRGQLFVSDTGNHRVLFWSEVPGDPQRDPDGVLGQTSLFTTAENGGGAPSARTLSRPTYLAVSGTRLVVADTGNHRVLVWFTIPTATGAPADAILGQAAPEGALPNRGGAPSAATLSSPEGVAVDGSDRLFVADSGNHRVLVYEGFSTLVGGESAAFALGQSRLDRGASNRGGPASRETLSRPRDVLVGGGRVYVADSGNHRVLVWKETVQRSGSPALGLFGQQSFHASIPGGPSPETLLDPAGLAMDPDGQLLVVSDTAHNRVLLFDRIDGEEPQGRSAEGVLGQSHLFTAAAPGLEGTSPGSLLRPRGLLFNGYELLAVDSGEGRLSLFR